MNIVVSDLCIMQNWELFSVFECNLHEASAIISLLLRMNLISEVLTHNVETAYYYSLIRRDYIIIRIVMIIHNTHETTRSSMRILITWVCHVYTV